LSKVEGRDSRLRGNDKHCENDTVGTITLAYRGGLADTIGLKVESIQAATVKDALAYIKEAHGKEAYKTAKSMVIAVNGINILKRQLYKTALEEGDKLTFLPISGGG
jgi:molybdopterin converting factor small subunit